MRLEKPQDSLLERGIFKCQLQHEGQVATVTFIPKRTPCYAISSFLGNPVIEEYEGSSVHKVLNPQMVTRIQDDEVPSLHHDLETDDSIHAIKEQYGKLDPQPAVIQSLPPEILIEYRLEISVQVKYSTIGPGDKLVKSSQLRRLRFKR